MGNCDSCLGDRNRNNHNNHNNRDEPVYHTSSSRRRIVPTETPLPNNEIDIQAPRSGSAFRNYRIVPFDRPPSIKIPEPHPTEKPRKPYGI